MPPARPFFQGVEGPERETMCHSYNKLHKAVTCQKSGEHKKAKGLWSLKEANDNGVDFYDLGSVQKIQTRSLARLECGPAKSSSSDV